MQKQVDLDSRKISILGGGPAGLTAGKVLSEAGADTTVFEMNNEVGGLSRTYEVDGFRFDLGGHRFFTKKYHLNEFLQELMGNELLLVERSSKIFLRGKYFNYPPTVGNAFLGFGPLNALHIAGSFLWERLKSHESIETLEDAIVRDYGRALFRQFFEPYNEKIWGVPCNKISAEWVAQRIKGLNLGSSLKNALGIGRDNQPVSLVESFHYPKFGIGRISEKLREETEKRGKVLLRHKVRKIRHDEGKITAIGVNNSRGEIEEFEATEVLSSIPITELVQSFDPPPPRQVLEATEHLAFRELIVVNVRFDRPPITRDTWIYVPEIQISFGRIHEPTNWSRHMSPEGKTSLVFEFWCNEGDWMWNLDDDSLTQMTIRDFVKLGMAPDLRNHVVGSTVVRCKKAYPMYIIGYEKPLKIIKDYLSRFENLTLIGRYGTFMYNNMDHVMETGIRAAANIMGGSYDVTAVHDPGEYMEEKPKG